MESSSNWFDLNVAAIEAELQWLQALIDFRTASHFGESQKHEGGTFPTAPEIVKAEGPFTDFVLNLELSHPERLVLILALAPDLRPGMLNHLRPAEADHALLTSLGAYKGHAHEGILPTIQTALFLLGGDNLSLRIHLRSIFTQNHKLFKDNWLRMEKLVNNDPMHTALLLPSKELVEFVTTGDMGEPEFGPSFPAQKIETTRKWEELILPPATHADIHDVLDWIKYEHTVMQLWRLGEKVGQGFRCLFHGPPGTGKTLTASLLGKATGRDVYRIDLSMVVSKYIGETEKNLKIVFDKAQSRGWILFFDEADALFGKRTDVSDSKDRYANQEVSYLLQRVETFDGVVILATNNRENMDKAFTRRFQMVINFPIPSATERLRLWETAIPKAYTLAPNVNLLAIANRFDVSGGSIMNVVRHCALRAAVRGNPTIVEADFMEGMRKEYTKSGRIMN